jgi:hypothetical protein
MLAGAALVIVVTTGLFLVALGAAALFKPGVASTFLLGFARTPTKHYAELAVRFIVGVALVVHAGSSASPLEFKSFGAVLILTTACMALFPWHKHRAFASRSVPHALRYLTLVGAASVASGFAILFFATA